jgi:hypothetical protein
MQFETKRMVGRGYHCRHGRFDGLGCLERCVEEYIRAGCSDTTNRKIIYAEICTQGRFFALFGISISHSRGDLIPYPNQWAKDQLMVILVANDIVTLQDKIENNSDFIYGIFDSDFQSRLIEDMFERGEQKDLENRFMTTYGWEIRLQRDYHLVQEFPNEGFLWFRRMYPERWIYVRWITGGDTTQLTPEWVVGERNRIGAKYYGGDRVEEAYFFSYRSNFLGRDAQITSGLWGNDLKVAGGPFKNYTFYDPLSHRLYMIDVAVWAPGRDKVPFLRRLDVTAHTFRTVFDGETEL